MLKVLAKIEGSAPKGIYLVIRFYGTVTFQDLLTVGYCKTTVYDSVKQLQSLGLIAKIDKGVYRLDRYGGGLFSGNRKSSF